MADGEEIPDFRLDVIQFFPALGGGIVDGLWVRESQERVGGGWEHDVPVQGWNSFTALKWTLFPQIHLIETLCQRLLR